MAQADEMTGAAELIHREIEETARTARDQDGYDRKYAAPGDHYRKAAVVYSESGNEIRKMILGSRQRMQMICQAGNGNAPDLISGGQSRYA